MVASLIKNKWKKVINNPQNVQNMVFFGGLAVGLYWLLDGNYLMADDALPEGLKQTENSFKSLFNLLKGAPTHVVALISALSGTMNTVASGSAWPMGVGFLGATFVEGAVSLVTTS